MPLVNIDLCNIRAYQRATLRPDPRITFIVGANASGKTTLLEAVHILSTGRSFRAHQLERVLRHGTENMSVVGHFQSPNETSTVRIGFSRENGEKSVTMNGVEQIRAAYLAQQLPLLTISPDTHFEFKQSTKLRRASLDWILFHVEPDFHDMWARYQRVLMQRNAALKDQRYKQSSFVWDDELSSLGDKLQQKRMERVRDIDPIFQETCAHLLGEKQRVGLQLDSGWQESIGLAECLRADRARDQARGFTHSGPHRNDLKILINNHQSKDEASHGQNKMLVFALRLAQIRYLYEKTGKECCLLIDDLAAELDTQHREHLANQLSGLPVQVFVTATEAAQLDLSCWKTYGMFHVEQGVIRGK
jgi:DNA replication and repair protein RecF